MRSRMGEYFYFNIILVSALMLSHVFFFLLLKLAGFISYTLLLYFLYMSKHDRNLINLIKWVKVERHRL